MRVHGPEFTPGTAGTGTKAVPKRNVEATPARAKDESAAPDPAGRHPARGVLRLLQEGHFSGVADVRLRINFADEIAALQAEASGARGEDGAEAVLGPLNAVFDQLVAQDGPEETLLGQIRDAAKSFQDAVTALFDAFNPGADPKGAGLTASIEAAFEAFVESLRALAPGSAPADPAASATGVSATTVAQGPTDPVAFGFGEFIDRLGEAFAQAISDLRDSFASAQILPELSGPNGRGGAYAKFLEILNGLNADGADAAGSGVDSAA